MITRIWSSLCMYFVIFFLSHLLVLLADNFFHVFASFSFSRAWVAFICFHPLYLICPSWFPLSFTFVCNIFFSSVSFAVLYNFLFILSVCTLILLFCYLFFLFWHSCSDNDFSVINLCLKKEKKGRKKEVAEVIFPIVINHQNHCKILYKSFISIFWSILWKLFLMDIR